MHGSHPKPAATLAPAHFPVFFFSLSLEDTQREQLLKVADFTAPISRSQPRRPLFRLNKRIKLQEELQEEP